MEGCLDVTKSTTCQIICEYYNMRLVTRLMSPRVYKKLVREIDDADQAGGLSRYVTYEECLKLPYL